METNDLANLRAISRRIPEGLPEDATLKVLEIVTFKVPGVSESNFRFHGLQSASVAWLNETENIPDDFSFHVKPGIIQIKVETNYIDYCFHKGRSVAKVEVNGRQLFFSWSTLEKDLVGKLKLLKRNY